MKLRLASHEDLPQLTRLQEMVQTLHAQHEPWLYRHATRAELSPGLAQLLDSEHHETWLALLDAQVAGYLVLWLRRKEATAWHCARQQLHVEQIGVWSEFRRRGVGTALMQRAEARASAQGISEILLSIRSFNRASQSFYQRLGYEVEQVIMRRPLQGLDSAEGQPASARRESDS